MKLDIIPCLNDNYSYLIKDDNSGIVAIIDPSEYGPCENIINQKYKKLDFILNTHHHFDHVGGNKELKKKYRSKVLGFEKDKERIPEIDILLKKDQEFKIGDLNFKTLFESRHGFVVIFCKFRNQEKRVRGQLSSRCVLFPSR